MLHSRTNPKKIIQKYRDQTQYYYEECVKADNAVKNSKNLYNHSVRLLVDNVKEKQELKKQKVKEVKIVIEKPVEVIKKVPYPVVKEVIKKVEVPVEVVKEVEKIVEKEVVKLKKVPFEVIKEIKVRDHDFENKLKEDIEQLKLSNLNKIDELQAVHQAELLKNRRHNQKKIKEVKDKYDYDVRAKDVLYKVTEDKYKAALVEASFQKKRQLDVFNSVIKNKNRSIKWMSTAIYFLSIYSLTQILRMFI